jgi:hypothetical protein
MRITGLAKVVLTIAVVAALFVILMSTQRARAQARCTYAASLILDAAPETAVVGANFSLRHADICGITTSCVVREA